MDIFSELSNWLGLGAGTGSGFYTWFQTKQNKSDIAEMKQDVAKAKSALTEHKLYAANNFAKSDDVKALGDRLERYMDKYLTRIEDKLDKKQDK